MNILWLDTVNSTNTYAKINIDNSGTAVASLNQTDGRGRMGRQWESGGSLALTFVHFPPTDVNLPVVSIIFGTAVCMAIKEVTKLDAKIKWPNDIVLEGKKLCGILTEAVTTADKIKLVCGVGINIFNKSFSEELSNKATSLAMNNVAVDNLDDLINMIYNKFNWLIGKGYSVPDEFKNLCVTLGKEIFVINGENKFKAFAVDVDENGGLIIKRNDGTADAVISGEVSVRGILGYV